MINTFLYVLIYFKYETREVFNNLKIYKYRIIMIAALFPLIGFGQVQTEKVVNQQIQTWVSVNTVTKFSNYLGSCLRNTFS